MLDIVDSLKTLFSHKDYTEGYALWKKMSRRRKLGKEDLPQDVDRAHILIERHNAYWKKRAGSHYYGADCQQDDSQWMMVD